MSILDSFFILFESDASKLDEGLAETDKKTSKLLDGLKKTDTAAGALGTSLAKSLAAAAGAVVAAASIGVLTAAVHEAVEIADHLDETAERLGIATEELSAWGDAVKLAGGSVDGFAGSLSALDKQLSQVEVTGKSRAAPFLKELGIDLDDATNKGKAAVDFLPQLADAFEKLSAPQAIALGSRLGLDQATIMTLQSGRRAVEELIARQKELGVVTTEQGKIAGAFNDQLDNTRHAFRSVWLGVAEFILPALTRMSEGLQNVALFMRRHSDFIVGLLIAIGTAITVYALPPLLSMAAAAVVAFAPFIIGAAIITAVATAFALLYDDVMNFIDGNDSLIGQILEKYPTIGRVVEGLVAVVRGLGQAIAWTFETMFSVLQIGFDLWTRLVGGVLNFLGVTRLVGGVLEALQAVFEFFGVAAAQVWDGIVRRATLAFELFKTIVGWARAAASAITGGLDRAKQALGITGSAETRQAVDMGREHLRAAAAAPLNSTTSNAISNTSARTKSTSVSIGELNVQTQATDAAGIAKTVGGTLEAQMSQAANNFDDGVLA